MSIFEALMLICFGLSWPVSIAKSLRTKVVSGKSPLFMGVLCVGYLSGVTHKLVYSLDWIVWLYVLNLLLVAFDLFLYYKYLPGESQLQGPARKKQPRRDGRGARKTNRVDG